MKSMEQYMNKEKKKINRKYRECVRKEMRVKKNGWRKIKGFA